MIKDYPCISTVDMTMSVQNSIHTNIHTQVSPLKYLRTLLYFSLEEGKYLEKGDIIIRPAHTIFKISFFSPGYIIKGGVPISRVF